MAILSTSGLLEEQVITCLAEKPGITAQQLSQALDTLGRNYTIQAVYQELRKLEKGGVVVKNGKLYSLRFLWIKSLLEFSQSALNRYISSNAILAELPSPGKKVKWTFNDLQSLLNFWTDLTFVLLRVVPVAERTLFERVEHIWFHTANPLNESNFVREMKREHVKYVLVSAGKTFLDRGYEAILKQLQAHYALGRLDFPSKENQYLSLVDDYVINVRLSKKLNQEIYDTYQTITSQSQLSPHRILQFAATRGACSLELVRDAELARRERRKFELFFDLR